MKAFLTGSLAYGTVSKTSDVDFFVYGSIPEIRDFIEIAEAENDGCDPWPEQYGSMTWRNGNTNWIVTTSRRKYYAWRWATWVLTWFAPVQRSTAVKLIQFFQQVLGVDC